MDSVLNQTKNDFVSLLDKGDLFPPDSKVAVMTTLIADDTKLTKVHDKIKDYQGIAKQPGFLDFIDSAAISSFKKSSAKDDYKEKDKSPGCRDKWFSPNDKVGNDYCFAAALQWLNHCVYVKAGARAFDQLLRKHKKKNLFTAGGICQVVFVSDTT